MANKTIPELQLIAAVTDSVQIPGDDSIQTYRLTAAQLKAYVLSAQVISLSMLNETILTGLTAVTPADDDFFPLVDTSDSNKTKKGAVSTFARNAYRSVTTTDTALATDGTLKLSGASFTQTLPTAVGIAGKRLKFIHAGTNLTQVYTMATTSGQTIGGIASGSYALYTNGEVLEVESNGANWEILNHYAQTDWVDAGALNVTGTTTNPTLGALTHHKFIWKRNGSILQYHYTLALGAGGAAGSGDYLFAMPANLTIDTTNLIVSASVFGTSNPTAYPTNLGNGYCRAGTSDAMISVYAADSTKLKFQVDGAGVYSAAAWSMANNPFTHNCSGQIPISGWRP